MVALKLVKPLGKLHLSSGACFGKSTHCACRITNEVIDRHVLIGQGLPWRTREDLDIQETGVDEAWDGQNLWEMRSEPRQELFFAD